MFGLNMLMDPVWQGWESQSVPPHQQCVNNTCNVCDTSIIICQCVYKTFILPMVMKHGASPEWRK